MSRLSWRGALAASATVRVALIVYGSWHDAGFQLQYTDVDYYVFADGAELVSHEFSPLRRQTYRYTPLLGVVLARGMRVHGAFGKLLFSLADLLTGCLVRRILEMRSAKGNSAGSERNSGASGSADSKRKSATHSEGIALLVLLNPFCIAVSTRGNADALSVLALLGGILLFEQAKLKIECERYGQRRSRRDAVRRDAVDGAAALLALATHLKPFVIVHLLSFLCGCADLEAEAPKGGGPKGGSCKVRLPKGVSHGGTARAWLSRTSSPLATRFLFTYVAVSGGLTLAATCACGADYWRQGLKRIRRPSLPHRDPPFHSHVLASSHFQPFPPPNLPPPPPKRCSTTSVAPTPSTTSRRGFIHCT